jgi:ABC-type nickel/cobalt efflux system permease component RcnA
MELAVGLMLIALGVANLRDVLQLVRRSAATAPEAASGHLHAHPHSHGDYVHSHAHGHEPESHPHRPEQTPVGWLDRHFGGLGLYQLVRPLVVGVVHGLAGSAAVALLVLATISNPKWAVLYLLIFGIGTIVGMTLITVAIALPFALSPRQSRFAGRLRLASGLVSVAFGLLLTYQIGIVHGLFTGHPHWTPQ